MSHSRKREWTHNGVKKTAWVASYIDAAGVKRQKTFATMKAADAFLKKVDREIEEGTHVAASESCTVEALCEEYIRHCETRLKDKRIGRSAFRTIRNGCDKWIIPLIGRKLMRDLRMQDVEDIYTNGVSKGLNPTTAKDMVRVMKGVQDYAVKRGYMKTDVVTPAKRELRNVPANKIKTFMPREVEHLLKVAGGPKTVRQMTHRMHAMRRCYVNVAAFCGLRFGEICGLRMQDLDLDHRTIKVRQNVTSWGEFKGPKTRAGIRDVPMPAHLVVMLRDWLERWHGPNEHGLVFSTIAGKGGGIGGRYVTQGNFWRDGWKSLLVEAGLDSDEDRFHFHALRHFAASWMIANGLPVTEVARLLGHAKFDMTLQVYAHPVMDVAQRHSAMDRMAEALLSPAPLLIPPAASRRHENVTH